MEFSQNFEYGVEGNKAPTISQRREDERRLLTRENHPQPLNNTLPEVIPKTQLNMHNLGNTNIYNATLASIGLDSPSHSQDMRNRAGNIAREHGQVASTVSTPVRNSATNLMALGHHVITPRQGRLWEARNKSPLWG